jgi:hypothetical protein
MSNAADIAAHTQRSTNVCPRIHAAVTDPSRKADADERRHCRAAAKGRIIGSNSRNTRYYRRRCKHGDDRAVSRGDDRQFNLITTTSAIQSPRRLCSEGNPPTNCIRFNKPRTLKSLSTRDVSAGE